MGEDRHSEAEPAELIKDPDERARREAENGGRQFRAAVEIIKGHIHAPEKKFRLRQSLILGLHEKALAGIHPLAGTYRNTPVLIVQSKHMPPSYQEVPDHVVDMCDYVNDNLDDLYAT